MGYTEDKIKLELLNLPFPVLFRIFISMEPIDLSLSEFPFMQRVDWLGLYPYHTTFLWRSFPWDLR